MPVLARDQAGWSPLHWAAAGGHAGCASALLEVGARPGAADERGRLPLHWAAERGWADAVSALVPAMSSASVDLHAVVGALEHPHCLPVLLLSLLDGGLCLSQQVTSADLHRKRLQ